MSGEGMMPPNSIFKFNYHSQSLLTQTPSYFSSKSPNKFLNLLQNFQFFNARSDDILVIYLSDNVLLVNLPPFKSNCLDFTQRTALNFNVSNSYSSNDATVKRLIYTSIHNSNNSSITQLSLYLDLIRLLC